MWATLGTAQPPVNIATVPEAQGVIDAAIAETGAVSADEVPVADESGWTRTMASHARDCRRGLVGRRCAAAVIFTGDRIAAACRPAARSERTCRSDLRQERPISDGPDRWQRRSTGQLYAQGIAWACANVRTSNPSPGTTREAF